MITRIKNKLKENKGASLILVLLLFLMCVMVSSAVVATATAGAGRNANRRQQQQRYLSILSATRLMAKEMESSGKFSGTVTLRDFGCNITGDLQFEPELEHPEEEIDESDPDNKPCTDVTLNSTGNREVKADELGGALAGLLETACTAIYLQTTEFYTTTFTIESEDSRLPNVTCAFSMDEWYNITMYLSVGSEAYAATLKFAGNATEGEPDVEEFHCKHDIIFTEVTEDGEWKPNQHESDVEKRGEKTEITTEVVWETAELQKGEH